MRVLERVKVNKWEKSKPNKREDEKKKKKTKGNFGPGNLKAYSGSPTRRYI